MKYALSLIAVAGLATVANASTTNIVWEVSSDGGTTWGAGVSVNPGTPVLARLRVSLDNTTNPIIGGTAVPAAGTTAAFFRPGTNASQQTTKGLAGLNFVGSIGGWAAGDALGAFGPEAGSGTEFGPGVNPGFDGRQAPFGLAGANSNGLPFGLLGGSVMSIQSTVATGNAVAIGQNVSALSGGFDGDGNPLNYYKNSLNIVVFMMSFTPNANLERDMPVGSAITAPAQWYRTLGSPGYAVPADSTTFAGANVHVTPTPGALALLGLGGLVAGRRRR